MNLKKNDVVTVTIEDNGVAGEGIGRVGGFTLFVKDGVPPDVLRVKVIKLKKQYGFAKIIEVLEASPDRRIPACALFGQCGGCHLQHMRYEKQLAYKTKRVAECFKRIGGFADAAVKDTIGMKAPWFYRNKAQFPVGAKDDQAVIGFYAPRSHRIVDTRRCVIQHPVHEPVLAAVRQYIAEFSVAPYDEETHTGKIRHVLIRTGFQTGETAVCIVVNGRALPFADKLTARLSRISGIVSVCVSQNSQKTNVIMGERLETIWGKPTITDELGGLRFAISPLSFYQINPAQTEVLYETALALCGLSGQETVMDLYCGIGTISLFLAKKAKHVIGVEVVEAAVRDAWRNARLNGIDNVTFVARDVKEVMRRLGSADDDGGSGYEPERPPDLRLVDYTEKVDVVVLDPPRKGCDEAVLRAVMRLGAGRVVYVSCDPATLARDARILCEGGFMLRHVQPVDLFPQTSHVECVVLMSRKDG